MAEALQLILERLLYGNRLEDKLYLPHDIDFSCITGELKSLPEFPGRPDFLKPLKGKSSVFPGVHELDDDKKRGEVLHFFANHELLAIELMALALLKFADCPDAFKKSIIKTIREEQKHLSLYCQRMQELGVNLGDIAVNSYFWDSMKNMQTPLDYVVQMSLTFEQANLDFSWMYFQTFKQMKDEVSANLMQEVLHDEIGHVGLGVVWLNKWKLPNETDWQAYVRLLPYPITPARGKGKIFYDFLRDQTGLSKEFVEEMRLFSFSKGRVPDILIYNPDCEADNAAELDYSKNALYLQMESDLGLLMTYFSVASDIVAVKKTPSKEFLREMQNVGVNLPQYVEVKSWEDLPKSVKDRKVRGLMPWGWSPRLKKWEENFSALQRDNSYRPKEILPAFQSKLNSLNLLKQFAIDSNLLDVYPEWFGVSCKSFSEVEIAIQKLRSTIGKKVVIRSEYGLAGQGMIRYFEDEMKANAISWCQQTLKTESLMVEPWLERVADCSCLIDIRNGQIKKVGVTRILNSFQGQYLGTLIGKPGSIFTDEITNILYDKSEGLELLWSFAEYAGKDYISKGYNGPLCIDAFFYLANHKIRLRPCVEINARFSMGRVALEISRQVMVGKLSLYCLVSKKDLESTGFDGFSALHNFLITKYPLQMNQNTKVWSHGYRPITDPDQAQLMLAVYFVGNNIDECREFYRFIKGKPWFEGESPFGSNNLV